MTNTFCVVGIISRLKDTTIFIDVVFDMSTKDTISFGECIYLHGIPMKAVLTPACFPERQVLSWH